MTEVGKARAVGINQVALEVADLEASLAFFARFFEFTLRGRPIGRAEIDLGDQFLSLVEDGTHISNRRRHLGLVVDNRARVVAALRAAGVAILPGNRLRFQDPDGNLIEVVDYRLIQFTKTPAVLAAMGLEPLAKTAAAKAEIVARGFAAP